jgi:hypothetical protein
MTNIDNTTSTSLLKYPKIIDKIIESRLRSLLNIISEKYPDKFDNKLIKNELEYIKNHIKIKQISSEIHNLSKNKIVLRKKRIPVDDNARCLARVWKGIYNRQSMNEITDLETQFKVTDLKKLNVKKFDEKYIIGAQCSRPHLSNEKYCKLHKKRLVHGDYTEIPSKDLCYHFITENNYM